MAIGDELASLDFESMIGGPLNAVVRAQAQAAATSVDFIKAVGFDDNDNPQMVSFTYNKAVEQTDGTTQLEPYELKVPFLTMVPIPFIRVEETTIDFNAKINSVQESSTFSASSFGASADFKARWGWGSARLKVKYSNRRSTRSSSKIQREYSLAVHVRAVQDELPAGTERLLGILESSIEETPAGSGDSN